MIIKLIIEYDGTAYHGWQSQPDGNTIQQKIEYALKVITNQDIKITGSGRTDSGVHAKGQVASFYTESNIAPEKYATAINTFLPEDIRIISSSRENDTFNARFSAKRKTYIYNMYMDRTEHPLISRYAVRINPVSVDKMKIASKFLIGEKDFRCFLASNSSVNSTIRTLYSVEIDSDGYFISVKISGNGFLYNMIRIIVGTLIDIGEGKISDSEFQNILDSKDRKLAGHTMPAKGLTLLSVEYDK